jgi:hypothetical protein
MLLVLHAQPRCIVKREGVLTGGSSGNFTGVNATIAQRSRGSETTGWLAAVGRRSSGNTNVVSLSPCRYNSRVPVAVCGQTRCDEAPKDLACCLRHPAALLV